MEEPTRGLMISLSCLPLCALHSYKSVSTCINSRIWSIFFVGTQTRVAQCWSFKSQTMNLRQYDEGGDCGRNSYITMWYAGAPVASTYEQLLANLARNLNLWAYMYIVEIGIRCLARRHDQWFELGGKRVCIYAKLIDSRSR